MEQVSKSGLGSDFGLFRLCHDSFAPNFRVSVEKLDKSQNMNKAYVHTIANMGYCIFTLPKITICIYTSLNHPIFSWIAFVRFWLAALRNND